MKPDERDQSDGARLEGWLERVSPTQCAWGSHGSVQWKAGGAACSNQATTFRPPKASPYCAHHAYIIDQWFPFGEEREETER